MNKPDNNKSSDKENKKVNPEKHTEEAKVREGENNSIYNEDNDKSSYPYPQTQEKQFNNQPEFIDRNAETKDKS
jgi:hypothetical protein